MSERFWLAVWLLSLAVVPWGQWLMMSLSWAVLSLTASLALNSWLYRAVR